MTDQQATQIINAVRALERNFEKFKDHVIQRLENIENSLTNLNNSIGRLAVTSDISVPSAPRLHPPPVPFSTVFPVSPPETRPPPAIYNQTGAINEGFQQPRQSNWLPLMSASSNQNVQWLPYAIEMVAWAAQRKKPGDERRW